jgi:hypothetical protein
MDEKSGNVATPTFPSYTASTYLRCEASMKSQSIAKELLHQIMQAAADEERRKKMRKILKTRKYPDEDDDPIDADPMRSFRSS